MSSESQVRECYIVKKMVLGIRAHLHSLKDKFQEKNRFSRGAHLPGWTMDTLWLQGQVSVGSWILYGYRRKEGRAAVGLDS